jgi:hypothetical protein
VGLLLLLPREQQLLLYAISPSSDSSCKAQIHQTPVLPCQFVHQPLKVTSVEATM